MKGNSPLQEGLQIVGILHIDTSNSRELYETISPHEKSICAQFLKRFFEDICKEHGGALSKWEGDGGFALFPFKNAKQFQNIFLAGKKIVEELPDVNAQTAKALTPRQSFLRHVRLKAHKGEVYLTKERGLDSADPKDFDDFLKHEKDFAPNNDEFFVTEPLYHHLNEAVKRHFRLFKKQVKGGCLCVDLYHLRREPVVKVENILSRGDEISTITQSEWNYLRNQIEAHFANVAARNQITKNLILHLSKPSQRKRGVIKPSVLFESTLDALYSYTCIIFPDCRIRVSYWRHIRNKENDVLKMVSYRYPSGESTNPGKRVLPVQDKRYKVCECFKKKETVATPCVKEARLLNLWQDLVPQHNSEGRALESALQIPVYCRLPNKLKEMKGVISLDADKPDMFLSQEVALWRDALVGFLANIALAEKLLECQA